MSDAQTFVRGFHDDLSRWFSGRGDRDETWRALQHATPPDMTLVYPSGARLTGAAFLDSVRDRHGASEGFVASVSEVRVVARGAEHVVVSYVESQTGAQRSTAHNQRSALAVIDTRGPRWAWRFIQETALPEAG